MAARWRHYQAVCDVMQRSGGVPGLVQNPLVYRPANLSLCWVPKVGCTFWMRIFFYLHNDTQSLWNPQTRHLPFDIDRIFVHFDGGQRSKTLRFDDVHEHDVIFHTRRVMFARDPWSRLWSGYIDKFVLPDSWLDHGKRILRMREEGSLHMAQTTRNQSIIDFSQLNQLEKNTTKTEYQVCSDDVSFAEFIHYALAVNHDPHWSPVHLTCNPCLFRPHYLGKMDTFFPDAAHVLRSVGLGHLLPQSSRSQDSHVRDEMKLLADYHFRLWERREALKVCLDRVGLARRLWRAFQLNGYIASSEHFPEELADQLNEFRLSEARDIFTKHVISVSSASSLSRAEWLALRRRTMMAAYREVPGELLKLIQQRFKLDFELFQYDPAPEELFVR